MQLRKLSFLTHTYKNIGRYRQILTVLFKYGYEGIIDRLNLGRYIEVGMRLVSRGPTEPIEILNNYERLRMAFEELGPTFVKMGQILSTRPDLIPIDLAQELSKLQDNVPPFPFDDARRIIEEELRQPLEDVYARFDEEPIAAASIGQVHRAALITGEEVAVKVQRPGIRKMIAEDLAILYHLALLLERYIEELRLYRPTLIVEEFARTIRREINFNVEASYAERFARQFRGNPNIYVPRVFRHATTERLLTMEYIEGIKASDIARLEAEGYDRKVIASRGTDLILEQVFIHGFFHADPHPGNVFILPGNVICNLDFGMMGHLDDHYRDLFSDIIIGYARRDVNIIAEAVMEIVEWVERPNRRAFERDLMTFMDLHLYKPLKELRVGDIMNDLVDIISRHQLRLPPDIFLMIKALSQVESIGLVLDPDFDMTVKVRPFIKRVLQEKYQPRRLLKRLYGESEAFLGNLKALPADLLETMSLLREGKIRLAFEHRGLERFIYELNRASNRLSFALIIAAIIIGSSLVITADIGPSLFGYPVLGLLGFCFAGILGVGLLIFIIRSGIL
ncbi:MAG TPA: AarF/UbiB family protein [Syntrophales bacterium]|nr:AarF/UbiB family protein [Syntrophales bacterium]HOM06158.1 AarF/UbiB family protein [Syntrophales bacterium]HON98978.1 AarF/UbiB family protein [Syntrophales bacterium]HPC01012.1 AarF/UbiB family protein [Syntrophales bacterium]HPQ05641.1 AarF/UbiB family protein [Syntrophales bacterium]